MKRRSFLILSIVGLSIILNSGLAHADEYDENMNGKIEATMELQLKDMQKEAQHLVSDMNLMPDSIDAKYGADRYSSDGEDYSQGRLQAVGQYITIAEDLKKQLDNEMKNDKHNIDEKYKSVNSLLRELRQIHKSAESILE